MSEHKLFDDIEDAVADVQDEIAEVAQGVYGKLKLNELKPRRYNISTSKKMLQDLLNDTQQFLTTLRSKELVGVKSTVEAFIGKLNQFKYLLDFCLKEDLKRRIKTKINENRQENEFRKAIHEAVITVLNKMWFMGKKIILIVCFVISVIMLNGCASLPYETTTYVSTPTYYYYPRTPRMPYYYYYPPKVIHVHKYHHEKPRYHMHHRPIKPNPHVVDRRPNNNRHR